MHTNLGKVFQIDEIDATIIRMLQNDGRRSYASIASELNLSPSTVQQRANRMIDEGLLVIKGIVHPDNLANVITAMIAVKADGNKLNDIVAEMSRLPEVRWVVVCAGQHDILIEVICRDNEHIFNLISEKLSNIPGVRETVTFPYLKIAKRTYEWVLSE
jgi:Lrp/AsnC family transcriptional regulator for asnA, asnC and gidA